MANKDTEVICTMKESFSSIRDTRQQSQVRHDLYEIIAMTIAAEIGNCDGWDEIEDFCQSKEKWLREHMGLELEHGIPSETTFARVWGTNRSKRIQGMLYTMDEPSS